MASSKWRPRMYDKIKYLGMTLTKWAEKLGNEFTPGELYQMVLTGKNISSLSAYNITNAS